MTVVMWSYFRLCSISQVAVLSSEHTLQWLDVNCTCTIDDAVAIIKVTSDNCMYQSDLAASSVNYRQTVFVAYAVPAQGFPVLSSYLMVLWCLINHRSYNAGETTTPNYSIDPKHLCLLNYKTQLPVQFLMTR